MKRFFRDLWLNVRSSYVRKKYVRTLVKAKHLKARHEKLIDEAVANFKDDEAKGLV